MRRSLPRTRGRGREATDLQGRGIEPRIGQTAAKRSLRVEIQALRAVAVTLVLVYHFWPGVVRGGFVGVDAFFVISGFLITAHLVRDIGAGGIARIPGFWARRARRLLPASLVVLGATAVAVLVVVPRALWQPFLTEVGAATLYVENWHLARTAVDYLAIADNPSPAQHFWSLSVEEQFYLLWPLLVAVALAVAAARARQSRVVLIGFLGAVSLVSFVYSVVSAASPSGIDYFDTGGRAWEFGAGALLAVLAPETTSSHPRLRAVASWVGMGLLLAAAFGYTGAVAFPGVAALLPVGATALVIWAGSSPSRWSATRLMALRPVQSVGDLSYSIYLWHWPVLVISGYAATAEPGLVGKVLMVVGILVLAVLTKRLVEDPAREFDWLLRRRPRWTFLASVVAMAMVLAIAASGWYSVKLAHDESLRVAERLASAEVECFGAATMARLGETCELVSDPPVVVPDPAGAISDKPRIYTDECRSDPRDPAVRECEFGTPGGTRVALIGDSHAASWFPALEVLAEERGWELHTFFKATCAFSDGTWTGLEPEILESCQAWNTELQSILAADDPFALVFTAHYTRDSVVVDDTAAPSAESAISAFRGAWAPLIDRGSSVIVLTDTPAPGVEGLECLIDNPTTTSRCEFSTDLVLSTDQSAVAATDLANAFVIDMNGYFCAGGTCPAVIGGVWVYRDDHHFTETFSRSLAPWLLVELVDTGVPHTSG